MSARVQASVEIERPPSEVFPWLVETDKRLRWVDGLESSEPLDGGEPRSGSRFREVLAQAGVRLTVETTIDHFDPPRGFSLRVRGRGVDATSETRVEATGAGSRVVSTIVTEVGGLKGRLVGGMVARQTQTSLERSFATLKNIVESAG